MLHHGTISASWKLFGATLLIVIGTVAVVVSLSVPTTICTTTTADSEVVERSCSTNERLSTVLRAALGVGIVAAAAGIGGVWRTSGDAGLLGRIVSGGVLLALGLLVAYVFGGWFWNLVTAESAGGSPLGLGLLLLVAVVGVGVAALGGRTLVRSEGSG